MAPIEKLKKAIQEYEDESKTYLTSIEIINRVAMGSKGESPMSIDIDIRIKGHTL